MATKVFAALARQLPDEFVSLLQQRLDVHPGDSVVEFGCGSGELAARLAARGIHVQAVDQSPVMIESARAIYHDCPGISWHQMTAEAFLDANHQVYSAFYAMEAFHLFREPAKLIARIADALEPGGTLGIAWRIGEWEAACGRTVPAVFERYGTPFSDWTYSMCHGLPGWLGSGWSEPATAEVRAPSRSTVPEIVDYLCAIDLASRIGDGLFAAFRSDIEAAVTAALEPDGTFSGDTRFGITVVRRTEDSPAHPTGTRGSSHR